MNKKCVLSLMILICVISAILPGCRKNVNTVIGIPEEESYLNSFTYEAVSEDIYGYMGTHPLYCYQLICCYSAVVDEFIKAQPDYDDKMSIEEFIKYREALLTDANRKALKEKAIRKFEDVMAMYIRSEDKKKLINDTRKKAIENQWKRYAAEYYIALKDIYPEITSPDEAMRFMTGCNVMEVISYMQLQASASNMLATESYEMKCTNNDIENYYNQHINEFRRVEVRTVYFTEKSVAESVLQLMKKRPQDVDNLAKAYNENPELAKTNGLVEVNSDCTLVPEEVKKWAYGQTEATLFEKTGNIELIESSNGWYVVLCNGISEFSDVKGNEIYREVAEAYKAVYLEGRIAWLKGFGAFTVNNMDYNKANIVLDNVM
ncbi:MAG: peptidyl-prolyl cis-trans isomerase [Ruminococcaceae bacterium]|nr:peptidyl-prolyl cis-trans isomerase [Oscillospiraceae bacterium]